MRKAMLAWLAMGLAASACADNSTVETTGTTASIAESTTTTPSTTTTTSGPPTIEVVADDYIFTGVPDSVEVGTEFGLRNNGSELHVYSMLRIPDGEERPVEELLALPYPELIELAPADGRTLFAMPGSSAVDLHTGETTRTADQPGRYVLICPIPQGTTGAMFTTGEEGDGPLHYTIGMWAELTVEDP